MIRPTLLALAGATTLASLHAADRPNILYILCDDLGYGDIGVFHQNARAAQNDRSIPYFTTPQIDTLAHDGMMLSYHYCGAPVCAPSRASFLTGRTQGHTEVRDNQFDKALPDTHTVGSVLQSAGYKTALIGKWGLQGKLENSESEPGWEAYPTRRGFHDFFGYVRHKDGHFHYPKEDKRQLWHNEKEVSQDLDLCFTTDLFTARAKSWITEQAKSPKDPFFLFLSFDTPHAVLHNPPCAFPEGGGLKGGLQWTGKPGAMINTAQGTRDGWMHPDYNSATWDHDSDAATPEISWPESQKRYANNVRRIDDCVGDLLSLLDDLEIADNTLVVFTSDNGPSKESYLKTEPYNPDFFNGFGPFNGIKRDTLEGGLREPTLVRYPRLIPAGKESRQPTGQWDWLATFTELAGLPAPASSDGVSLLPILAQKGERREGTLYVEYFQNGKTPNYPPFSPRNRGRKRGQMQVVIAEGLKGLRYQVKSAKDDFEIYDISKDPSESNNLAKKKGFEKMQALFKAKALQSRIPSPGAKRPYDKALIPALAKKPDTTAGITFTSYPGSWPWLPDFEGLKANPTEILEEISLPDPTTTTPFGATFEGFFHASIDGEYTFKISAKGMATLFIHNCRLISEQKTPVAETTTGTIRLKAGWHPIRLLFRHTSGEPHLEFSGTTPNGTPLKLESKNLLVSPLGK
ncbi:sulfatase-like hydrolase/transferase [Verrucomicrobiaceae bacterium 227]